MKQIPILSGKAMIVELKHKPIYMEIIHSGDLKYEYEESETGPQKYTYVNLPPGTWQIVGMLSEVTEGRVAGLVKSHDTYIKGVKEPRVGFLDYNRVNKAFEFYTYKTSLESLESAILAEGYLLESPPAPKCGCTGPAEEGVCDACDEWMTAQSRVLARSRCLLLGREDG